ncbi:MAG: ATP-binding protein [Clostridia bacterium]|jgi:hypothetical protein
MIKREIYMKKIRKFMDKKIIKVITGIRRCGKSVMLQLIIEELIKKGVNRDNILLYNFESAENTNLTTGSALYDDVKERISRLKGRVYLFFDEVQDVAEWEKYINSFQVDFDVDIYVTGSNAKLLSGELATLISGRYVEITIYPLSYIEFMSMYRTVYKDTSDEDAFRKYIVLGGMPFLLDLDFGELAGTQYLHDIYTSVVIKDVMKRNNFRDIDLLERIILYIAANIGQTFSAMSISNFFKSEHRKVATETVINHLKACEEAFLFHKVRRQDVIGKRILQISEKYYIADHGIREAIYGNNQRDIAQVLENLVFMEMLRRGYKITVGRMDSREIDFICERGTETIYLQVTYLLNDTETVNREFDVLKKIPDNFPKYVLSLDEIDLSRDGIKHMNVREFLKG